MSERRACQVARGRPHARCATAASGPDDAAVRARLRELAAVRRRFGYRRLHVLLRREGHHHEPQEAPPALPRGTAAGAPARRPQAGARHPGADDASRREPTSAGASTSCRDAFADGRRFRILAVVDDFTRECLALVADTSLPGLRVARELDAIIAGRGRPAMCVSDNGTELTGMADPALVPGEPDRVALHRARQAEAERLHRELQRPAARRTPQRDAVHLARACPSRAGGLEGRLQQRPAAQRARQSDTDRIRQSQRSRTATGRGAALRRGLRAPPRCSTEPHGLKCNRDSPHRWMKQGAQTTDRVAQPNGRDQIAVLWFDFCRCGLQKSA